MIWDLTSAPAPAFVAALQRRVARLDARCSIGRGFTSRGRRDLRASLHALLEAQAELEGLEQMLAVSNDDGPANVRASRSGSFQASR